MLKLVIFDFDGTLCDSIPLCIRAFRAAIEPLAGRSVSDQEIIETFGPSEEGTIQALIPAYLEEGTAAYLRCYEAFHEDCRVFPGMRELLAELRKQGMKTALVTGKGMKSCAISLKKLGLSPVVVRKVAIAMYEGEINMVIHGGGGQIAVEIGGEDIRMSLSDHGPGIPNIALAMQEGWSTAPEEVRNLGFGAGMGLPNMKKYSDEMEIISAPGEGTTVNMTVHIA